MSGAKLTKLQVDAILKEGAYYCLDDYALRAEILEKINAAFLDGIARLAGAALAFIRYIVILPAVVMW